jgi:hypothetical protein
MNERFHAPIGRQSLTIQVWAAVLTGSGASAGHISVAHARSRAHTRGVAVATVIGRSHAVGCLVMLRVEVRVRVRLEVLLGLLLLLVVAGGAGVGVGAGGARRGATVGCV